MSAIDAPVASRSGPTVSAPGSIRRTESRFVGAARTSLYRCSWQGSSAKRQMALVHGFGEHCLRYDGMAVWFARRGYAVHSFDLRGHGRSPGPRGHVDRFSQYLDDLDHFLDALRAEAPDSPIHLVGHSLGGLVVASYVRERHPDLASVAISGAALEISPDVPRFKIALARILRRLAPKLAMEAGIDAAGLSSDPEVGAEYGADPLVHGRMTASHAHEMLQAIERARVGGEAVRTPILVQHGEADRLCPKSGSENFYTAQLDPRPIADRPAHELRIYPGMRHEIYNEHDKEQVYLDLLDWQDRCDHGAVGAAR